MSTPQARSVTLVVDGVECAAPEGTMLVDAAKHGDVEIPVFCYEPKLGDPVGACRMCLVEIEGIPKLQTACSTPIRDGMVVYTKTDRVKEAHNAIVEFLLVNHPLDCPVCDKGGECPLQDISMGWGPGTSRFTDPKRHFQKPIPLSPLVKIDRERCILCYRCVRFSQEVSEDEQLQLLERGDRTFVGTHEDRPYIAPFHGNIIELCPVGALTSQAYRFRARPWEIEDAGSICTLCPSQCNIKFTVRDERATRVLARDNAAVDDGWLCDKGRFGYQMFNSADRSTAPRIREAGALRPASWGEALDLCAERLDAAGARTAAIVGGDASNEEGYLVQRIVRQALGSPHVDSRAGGTLPRELLARLSRPELGVAIGAIDSADAVLVLGCEPMQQMPILDLRIRKAVRRNGTRLAVASERPTTLDGGAAAIDSAGAAAGIRYAPGELVPLLANLLAALGGAGTERSVGEELHAADGRALADVLRDADDVVIVWGERVGHGPEGPEALAALLEIAAELGLGEREGSGLLEVPDGANARGLREVGCLPTAGPGLSEAETGMSAAEIRAALEADELSALILWNVDPIRDFPDSEGWARAIGAADFVLSVSMFATSTAQGADVHLPAETHGEKEGTVTHPDGRLQRLRPGLANPGEVKPLWEVLCELAARLDHETGFQSAPDVLAGIAAEVPFYAGITHDEIGGRGVRWQDRDVSGALEGPGADSPGATPRVTAQASESGPGASRSVPGEPTPDPSHASGGGTATDADRGGRIRLGTYRDLWAGEVPERNPALRFLIPGQTLELASDDAARLGVGHGDAVEVASNGTSVRARVAVRDRMRAGAGFLIEGLAEENANLLAGAEVVEVRQANTEGAE